MSTRPRSDGSRGGGTRATALLAAERVAHVVHAYDHDPSERAPGQRHRAQGYGAEAAAALDVDADRVFKTLVAEVDGRAAVAVVPVSGTLDLKALAAALNGKRAVMAEPADAERLTGYVTGGISPLGQRRRLPTVVDASALDHTTVYVSAGQRGLDVEMAPGDLIRLTGARTAVVSRAPAEHQRPRRRGSSPR